MTPGYDSWKARSPDDDLGDQHEPPTPEQERADWEDQIQQQTDDDSAKRARVAYETFRGGLIPRLDPEVPRWEDAPNWIRDVALVAYLQGTLDAPKRS